MFSYEGWKRDKKAKQTLSRMHVAMCIYLARSNFPIQIPIFCITKVLLIKRGRFHVQKQLQKQTQYQDNFHFCNTADTISFV